LLRRFISTRSHYSFTVVFNVCVRVLGRLGGAFARDDTSPRATHQDHLGRLKSHPRAPQRRPGDPRRPREGCQKAKNVDLGLKKCSSQRFRGKSSSAAQSGPRAPKRAPRGPTGSPKGPAQERAKSRQGRHKRPRSPKAQNGLLNPPEARTRENQGFFSPGGATRTAQEPRSARSHLGRPKSHPREGPRRLTNTKK